MDEVGHRIHDAAKKGNIEDVGKLLKEFPELVNDKGEDGWTPMFRACYNNRLELAQFLAEHGANMGRDADDFQNTPLHACCINGHMQVAEYLLAKGVDVNEYENVGGWTPVYAAAFFGWPNLVRLLLKHGADPTISCKEGKRPIDVVCEAGYRGEHKPTIEALLLDRPEPVLPPRSARVAGSSGSGERKHRHGQQGHSHGSTLRAHATAHAALSSTLPASLGLNSPGGTAVGVGGPPPYTEDRLGTRVYFPWELSNADYVGRGLAFCQAILTRLFKAAVEAGKLSDMPRARASGSKPFLDAFDLLVVALEHEKGLGSYLDAKNAASNGAASATSTPCCDGGSEHTKALPEQLEGIGKALAQHSTPNHTPSREEVDALLVSLHTLAAHVHLPDLAEDIQSLLDQFHTHVESKSLRLRMLRVSQIRGTLEGHERVSGGSLGAGGSGRSDGSGSGAGGSPSDAGSSSRSSSLAGGGVSGGYTPVGLDAVVDKEQSRKDFLQQYKFLEDHTKDLVLNDDV